jgi:hypothetical protein
VVVIADAGSEVTAQLMCRLVERVVEAAPHQAVCPRKRQEARIGSAQEARDLPPVAVPGVPGGRERVVVAGLGGLEQLNRTCDVLLQERCQALPALLP